MPKIRVLPENLSNKIAAGEVVERPASVVKELLENALDAESTRIIIEVEEGGRSLIQISDNGVGMRPDDALLAIERYATSKISSVDDLFSIQTLGFRGEALPSIASVSRFSLITRDKSSDAGTEIIVEGGKVKSVTTVGAPPGTMVSVKQLFFNTPARKKFLKTVGT
jgi:DNA mismatch repair protein MutL